MKESNGDLFLSKFTDRIEKIGKEGVRGLMKNTNIAINPNQKMSYVYTTPNSRNKASLIQGNQYDNYFNQNQGLNLNYQTKNSNPYLAPSTLSPETNFNSNLPSGNYSSMFDAKNQRLINNSLIHKSVLPNIEYAHWNKYPNVIPMNNSDKNPLIESDIQSYAHRNKVYEEHNYNPYTLKDYKELKQNIKLGGLGANIGTKEWRKSSNRRKKMGLYGSAVMKENKGIKNFLVETPTEVKIRQIKEQREISVRNRTHFYGRNIKLKTESNTDSTRSRYLNNKEDKNKKDFYNVLELNRQMYFQKLAKLKESLVY